MTDPVAIALIATITPTIASIAALIIALINRGKIEQIHKATNSMKDALVASTRKDALQEGHTAGVRDEKANAALIKEKS